MTRALGLAILLGVAMLVTIVVRAPAAWLGDWVETRSKLRLIDARGTVWQGSALLGISDGRATTLLPGRLEWRVEALSPVRLSVSHPWLAAPLVLSLSTQNMGFKSGSARLPAGVLASAGAPFNTVRPGGVLELAWTDGELRGAALTGELQVDWRDAQSALKGTMNGARIKFNGTATAEPAMQPALNGLLGVLGMRSGDKVLLAIDS